MTKVLPYCFAGLIFSLSFWACKSKYLEPTIACSGSVANVNDNHPKKAIYEAIMDKYVKKGLPGIVLLIRDENGVLVAARGKADIKRNIPMQVCHVSKIASITKTFVGVLTMKLVEEGRLRLDAQISEYLPADIIRRVKNANKVTLRQLLTHTTGIYDVIDDSEFYLDVVNNPTKKRRGEDFLKFVYDKPAVYEPDGIRASYSNTNTLLVAMIIDQVMGVPHERLVREKILVPLGLQNTYYFPEDNLPTSTAQGYFDLYNNGTIVNMSNYNTSSGYGGIYSNVNDLLIFCDALLRAKTLVSPASFTEMTKWTADDGEDNQFGIGLIYDFFSRPQSQRPIGHTGRDLAYSADMFYFPNQDATMIWLVNYGGDAKSNLKPVLLDFEKEVIDEVVK